MIPGDRQTLVVMIGVKIGHEFPSHLETLRVALSRLLVDLKCHGSVFANQIWVGDDAIKNFAHELYVISLADRPTHDSCRYRAEPGVVREIGRL